MKKLVSLLLVMMCLFVGCTNEKKSVENENLEKVNNQEDDGLETIQQDDNDEIKQGENEYLIEISAQEFKEKVNSNARYMFFIGRDTCPACQKFKPIASEFANAEKFAIYYVNGLTSDDWDIIDSVVQLEYIPTIVFSENGSILYNEYGVKSYETLQSLVEQYME